MEFPTTDLSAAAVVLLNEEDGSSSGIASSDIKEKEDTPPLQLTQTSLTQLGPGAIVVHLDLRKVPNITAIADASAEKEEDSINDHELILDVEADAEDHQEDIQLRRQRHLRSGSSSSSIILEDGGDGRQRRQISVAQQEANSRDRLQRLLLAKPFPIGTARIFGSMRPLNFVSRG